MTPTTLASLLDCWREWPECCPGADELDFVRDAARCPVGGGDREQEDHYCGTIERTLLAEAVDILEVTTTTRPGIETHTAVVGCSVRWRYKGEYVLHWERGHATKLDALIAAANRVHKHHCPQGGGGRTEAPA